METSTRRMPWIHLGEFIGQQAHLVIVTLHGCDVFFNHHSSKGGRRNRHLNAPFMAGVAHRSTLIRADARDSAG